MTLFNKRRSQISSLEEELLKIIPKLSEELIELKKKLSSISGYCFNGYFINYRDALYKELDKYKRNLK